MIVIAEPYVRFAQTLDGSSLGEHAQRLLSVSEEIALSHDGYRGLRLKFGDGAIAVSVRVEQGSTRAWITITAVVGALTLYGEIRESIDYLVRDARTVGRLLVAQAPESLGLEGERPEMRQLRAGQAGRLKKLFRRVEVGDLSADDATRRAMKILYEVRHELPVGLGEQLARELEEAEAAEKGSGRKRLPREVPREFALLPERPRRRRIGVIARRDPRDGQLRVDSY